jgi:hypothetical protein
MKTLWTNKYQVVGIKPGKVYIPGLGILDLSSEKLPLDRVQKAYDKGCKYLIPIENGTDKAKPKSKS